jgi:hypothetical protein
VVVRKVVLSVLVVVAPVAGWVALVYRDMRRLEPQGQTLAEHLARMPAPESFGVFEVSGDAYLAVIGPSRSLLTLPSGPAVYVFDRTGRLRDWTPDEGDDPRFFARWPGAKCGREVSRQEAEGFVR